MEFFAISDKADEIIIREKVPNGSKHKFGPVSLCQFLKKVTFLFKKLFCIALFAMFAYGAQRTAVKAKDNSRTDKNNLL